MFAKAYSEGYIDEDIMKHIPTIKKKSKMKELFKPAEVDAVLTTLHEPFSSLHSGLVSQRVNRLELNGKTLISDTTSSM